MAIQLEIQTAIEIMKKYKLSGNEQETLEEVTGKLASEKNWTRGRASQYLHRKAFPNA